MIILRVRVVSWNVHFRGPEAAKRQGDLLRELAPDLMLLQELNPGSSAILADAAGADWMVRAIDLRAAEPDDTPVRRRGVAIAGRGLLFCRSWLLDKIRLPERILLIETQTEGTPFVAVSYHAPPGVSWGIVKPQQAVAFASWLSRQNGPLLLGADANTPLIDTPDFANTRTHWHTGRKPCAASLVMISCSALTRSTISKTRCAAGSPFIPMRWPDFGLSPRGLLPSPIGLGSAKIRRARTDASILSGLATIGSCSMSSTSTRRA